MPRGTTEETHAAKFRYVESPYRSRAHLWTRIQTTLQSRVTPRISRCSQIFDAGVFRLRAAPSNLCRRQKAARRQAPAPAFRAQHRDSAARAARNSED